MLKIKSLEVSFKSVTGQESRIIPRNFEARVHKKLIKKIAGEGYRFDNYNKPIFNALVEYFNGKSGKIPLNKGLLLVGEVGSGKTTIFQIFRQYCYLSRSENSFNMVSMQRLVEEFRKNGNINSFTFNYKRNHAGIELANPVHYCFDDIASEVEAINYFGNNFSPFSELIEQRYELFKYNGILTHGTSNLAPDTIRKKVDIRIADRLREMFYVLELSGGSRRK